jgi:hypothetical protein
VEQITGSDGQSQNTASYSVTNRGLHIELPLVPLASSPPSLLVAWLNCHMYGEPIAIILKQDRDQYIWWGASRFGVELGAAHELIEARPKAAQHALIFVKDDTPDREITPSTISITATIHEADGYNVQCVDTSTTRLNNGQWRLSGTNNWSLQLRYCMEGTIGCISLKSVHSADKFAIVCGLRGRVLWTEIITNSEAENNKENFLLYDLETKPQVKDWKIRYPQYLDRSSTALSSEWSVILASSLRRMHDVWNGEIDISFERRMLSLTDLRQNNKTLTYQVNLSVR